MSAFDSGKTPENLLKFGEKLRGEEKNRGGGRFDGTLDELVSRISELYPDIRTNLMTGEVEGAPDAAIARFRIEAVTGKTPKKDDVNDAIRVVADRRKYDPLDVMLEKLPEWDGVPRLSRWLIAYGKAPDLDYVKVVGRKWLISAIARAKVPGCQVDYSLVLQGPQRKGKTSALRILGGDLYRSMTGKVIGTKDTKHELRSCWIAEFADLGALPKSEVGVIKAFLTDRVDSYTWKWKSYETVAPRRCVFAVSDNPDGSGWLSDSTGAFRWWPVDTGEWDLEGLSRDRDQLLAEAVVAYKAGEQWWIANDDPVQAELNDQQDALQQHDDWENVIGDWLDGIDPPSGQRVVVTTSGKVLSYAVGVTRDKWSKADQMRVGKILKSLGFRRVLPRINGRRTRQWQRE
jgi:putative DNA primase/helicase